MGNNSNKVHLNQLAIILGTNCNLKCPHCLGGNPNKMQIEEEYIDALTDCISGIDELSFFGYETTLYIDKIHMVFEKLINANIIINRFSIFTNAVSFSEKLVDLIKLYQGYVKKPERVMLHFSDDSFHYNDRFTQEECFNNIQKYIDVFGDSCQYSIQKFDKDTHLLIQGRAKELSSKQTAAIPKILIPINNKNYFIEFRDKCEGIQNTCNNGNCVCNCIVTPIVLTPNGFVFSNDYLAFNAIATNDYSQSIGHICEMSLMDMVVRQNEHYDKRKDKTQSIVFRDENSYAWAIQKLIYDYLMFVENAIKAAKDVELLSYNKCKMDFSKNAEKLRILYENNIEHDNELYSIILEDYSTITNILDSYFVFPFFKPLFAKQIEMYQEITPFRKGNFKEFVGIEYEQFMQLWNCYNMCDYDGYVSAFTSMKSK